MKTTPAILTAAWLITLTAAFTLGSKFGSSSAEKNENHPKINDDNRSTSRFTSRDRKPHPSSQATNRPINSTTTSSGDDPKIVAIMNTQNPLERTQALIDLIKQLKPDDFEKTITNFRNMGITRERMSEYAMLLHAWGKIDPMAALEFAQKNTGSPFARQTILASWAEDSPDAAISWAQRNHEGEQANPWLVGVIQGLAASDPKKATEILTTLPYSRERGDALASIAPHIAKLGQEKAREWLDGIEDERLRAGGASYIADILAKTDPAATAQWVLSLGDDQAISRAAGTVAGTWAETDLDAAISWTDSLPDQAKSSAARQIISEYASEDPAKASAWLSTMTGQPGYQEVVTSYIWHTARNHPEMSLAHVSEITDERSQLRYYERIYSRWHEKAPDAAQAWMQNSQLPEDTKKHILERQGRDRR